MAETKIIDYYAILNLPPTADLVGIDNAYARLSNELAHSAEIDETAVDALKRLNEAYAVLSKPNLRIEYDSIFFKTEIERREREELAMLRRRRIIGNFVVGALALVVLMEAAGLLYFGREYAASVVGWV